MISIRKINYAQDIDDISKLLMNNFPTNKTKDQFIWKHLENPFGKSFGLVATYQKKIVGLRMFMRWEFKRKGEVIRAIRPVDTCTDTKHRGKGIFKKLTQKGLSGINKDYDIIFNTPNEMSRGGYLKMGWKKIRKKVKYRVAIVNPFKKALKFSLIDSKEIDSLHITSNTDFGTNLSSDFLRWRYRDEKYKKALFSDQTLVIYKEERIKGFRVIVLLNIFNNLNKKEDYLSAIANSLGVYFIYYLNCEKLKNTNFPFSISRASQVVVAKDDAIGFSKDVNLSAGDLDRLL